MPSQQRAAYFFGGIQSPAARQAARNLTIAYPRSTASSRVQPRPTMQPLHITTNAHDPVVNASMFTMSLPSEDDMFGNFEDVDMIDTGQDTRLNTGRCPTNYTIPPRFNRGRSDSAPSTNYNAGLSPIANQAYGNAHSFSAYPSGFSSSTGGFESQFGFPTPSTSQTGHSWDSPFSTTGEFFEYGSGLSNDSFMSPPSSWTNSMSDPRNSPAFLPTDSDDCQMNLTSTSHSIQIPNSGSSSHYTIRASDATNQPLSSPSVNDFASGGQWGFLDEPGPEVFSVSVDEHLPQGWSMVEHSTSNNHVQNHNYAASFTTENSAMDEIYADVHSEALPIRQPGSTRNDYMDTEPQVNEFNDRLIPNDGDFLREDGRVPVVPYRKGSRKGPLEARKKGVTAERRKNKSVCIRCQTMRIECDSDGTNPCTRCVKADESDSLLFPCINAHFYELVKAGTCNYICAIHPYPDSDDARSPRAQRAITDDLLRRLWARRNSFNIRVSQGDESLYVLDLAKCHHTLNGISESLPSSREGHTRGPIDDVLAKSGTWTKCIKECDVPEKDHFKKLNLLSKLNNTSSPATYSLIPLPSKNSKGPERERILDPDDPTDQPEIMFAAQLSRTICRRLELEGYKSLQTAINNIVRNPSTEDKIVFVQQMGKLLCSLRWRLSSWEMLLGISPKGKGRETDSHTQVFIDRVRMLSKVLYLYSLTVKTKIPPIPFGGQGEMTDRLAGEWSTYPDAQTVWDDFPAVCSVEGFEEWMARGRQLIAEVNVQGTFPGPLGVN